MDSEILNRICELQNKGEKAVLVTIVETRGSTPRKAGSKMLILPDGTSYGTIGGGCAEGEVRRQALTALDVNCSSLYTVSMLNDMAADEGMVCGGIMEVFIQII
ncbi:MULTISPECIES: XdhC family protein [Pelosinus]|jgi:xanthine dehydrogenase accessory factor|uniref:XshC-Cox1-family protein n=1 Tax=Pelosinus fermentans B4 TaxID=1149862 RepID=I9LIN2_9FIRM|nr:MULTISPECIES: XdhC family protein [Pelosinus]EIW20256.1 XshC-Cox1-family protein [Pelosinus fermentans B4]EIW25906.1 XshC-Cox1-family protein [Pelosinus fermentans A11]OAM93204.1 XshC-Cox1-family protein [Pelosinus fermentans DSM 17108]SDQ70227.1 XdhC and CoxI family protein [Pelosinus fermentans]